MSLRLDGLTPDAARQVATRALARSLLREALALGPVLPPAPRPAGGRPERWSRAQVLAAVQAFTRQHGRLPLRREFAARHGLPNESTLLRHGWTVAEVVRAAQEAPYAPA